MNKPNKLFSRLRLALLSSALPALVLSTQGQSITNGLVAYWNFDQKNAEDSVGIYDGTENGSAPIAYVPGKAGFGSAVQLDGSDQMIEITSGDPDELAFEGGSMTVAGWFKVGTFDKDWQALIAKGEGNNWRIHRRGGETGFAHAGGTGEGPVGGAVNDGNWHHFAAISDVDGVNFGTALYVDGVQYTVNASIPNLSANGKPVMIGENPDARNRYWNGLVDDVALWNRVLSENEIASLYFNGTGKPLSSFMVAEVDTDKDGMPDSWENLYGLNPNDPTDAAQDKNVNGWTNLEEYQRGADPTVTTRPAIIGSKSSATFDTVTVTFSKPLDPVTATNITNYVFSPNLTVTGATLKGAVVTLNTAQQTPGGTAYTLTVNNVKDLNNFAIPANTKSTVYSYILTKTGVLKFSYWSGIGGTAVDELLLDPRYPTTPDLVGAVFTFSSRDIFPDDSHENFGATIEGFLTPAESGSYRFFINSDDASQLHLSTDETEANLVQIAEETGCCNAFTEPDSPRTSEPIALVAGQKYFVRLIYKEGGGGDYGRVAWRKEGDLTAAGLLNPIPGKFLSSAVDLPAPAEGVFLTQTPAPNAKNVAPVGEIRIVHIDGKSAWTSNNVTLKFDGTLVKPTYTKEGNVVTLVYAITNVLASKTKHFVTLGYPNPAGTATTLDWSFETAAHSGTVKDSVNSYSGIVMGVAKQSADRGGRSGAAGDRGLDLGNKGNASVFVPDAKWLNAATANNELTVSLWVKRYDINDSSAFWLVSPGSNNGQRGFQAHIPWSNNNIYFDTSGCCEADTQRINDDVANFGGYTGDVSWWTNSWHHFVFQKKGDTKTVYIDGDLFMLGNNTAPLPTDFTRLFMGSDSSGTGGFMHGQIDDFAIFEKELTQAQITSLFTGTSPTALPATTKLMAFWDFNTVNAGSTPIANDLVAYWNFDGNLQDSVKNFHGTARGTNAIPFVAGRDGFGQAIKLDGNDQFVEITGGNEDELEFAGGSMSIAGWFKVDTFDTDWQALISKGEGTSYRVARRAATGTVAYAGGAGEGADDIAPLNDGLWHHFVAVSDATGVPFGTALYIDGVLHGVQTAAPVLTVNTNRLFIGENPGARGREWEGLIDDIAIWKRVLSPTEVAALWNDGAGKALSTFPGVGGPQPAGVTVTISRSGTTATIQWSPAGGTLESSPTIGAGATWTTVGTANPATITIGTGNRFYRIRQ